MRAILVIAMLVLSFPAQAHPKHHHHRTRTVPDFAVGLGYGMVHMLDSIQPHPSGCPHTAFCGCGVSVKVYGHPVRDLYLAANWFRFPRAAPGPGKVAVRRHHVFYIEAVNGDGTVTAYDPNSGGHLTRIHNVRLAGYTVVDPR